MQELTHFENLYFVRLLKVNKNPSKYAYTNPYTYIDMRLSVQKFGTSQNFDMHTLNLLYAYLEIIYRNIYMNHSIFKVDLSCFQNQTQT